MLMLALISCQFQKKELLKPIRGISIAEPTYEIDVSLIGQGQINVFGSIYSRVNHNIRVTTDRGEVNWISPIFYQGDNGSFHFKDGQFEGFIDGERYTSERENRVVVLQVDSVPEFQCDVLEYKPQDLEEMKQLVESQISLLGRKEVSLYWELRYDLVSKKGGVVNAVNWITGVFNIIQPLYVKDGIYIKLKEVFAWSSADPYPANGTASILNAFSAKNYDKANLHHLIGMPARVTGGISYLNVLCAPNQYRTSFSEVYDDYSSSAYSWTINVLSHEMGHALASPHTHSCSWPNGPIDGCAPSVNSAYAEGTCPTGPIPNKGTIMSYCHLLPNVGIDIFGLGFGAIPKNLILNTISGASCVSTVDQSSCSDGIQNGSETGIDCGGSCPPCSNQALKTLCSFNQNNRFEYINEVVINTKSFPTGKGYYSSTDTVNVNSRFSVKISIGWNKPYDEGRAVFIDLNRNGTFESNENFSAGISKDQSSTFSINDMPQGLYRLRVVIEYKKQPEGCRGSDGEHEDYIINVISNTDPCLSVLKPSISIANVTSGQDVINPLKLTVNVSQDVLKVEMYENGIKKAEDTTSPFEFQPTQSCNYDLKFIAYNTCKLAELSIVSKTKWN